MKIVNNKVRFINKYPTDVEIYSEKPVEVYIDEFCFDPIPKGSIRIVMMEEPLRSHMFELVQNYPDYYDIVLTYEDEILQTNPKARLFRCADTWVYGCVPPYKKFAVSTVVGGKNDLRMSGYAMRHELYHRKEEIKMTTDFYLSNNSKWVHADYNHALVLGDTKTILFDCMFHIAIENRAMKHYFSEKLLDCFQTRTIPIYCGCENIEDYFNMDGIFKVNSVEEIISVCNSLTEKDYHSRKDAMEENFQLAQGRVNYFDQLKNKITETLKSL